MVDPLNRLARRLPTWPFYILCLLPIPWLFWQGLTGGLGVEPIKALEHEYGELALKFLVASLCITPLRRFWGVNLIKFRRMIGLMVFFCATAHFAVWLVLDVQIVSQIWADIVKRPYVTVGFLSFVMLLPLAMTSNGWSIRRMGGAAWRRLHMMVYPAAVLAGLHYIWLVKGFQIEPLVYMAVILGLLALRLQRPRRLQQA